MGQINIAGRTESLEAPGLTRNILSIDIVPRYKEEDSDTQFYIYITYSILVERFYNLCEYIWFTEQ